MSDCCNKQNRFTYPDKTVYLGYQVFTRRQIASELENFLAHHETRFFCADNPQQTLQENNQQQLCFSASSQSR